MPEQKEAERAHGRVVRVIGPVVDVEFPPGELPADWREAIAAIARRSRAVFRRHPWAVTARESSDAEGPNGLRHFESWRVRYGAPIVASDDPVETTERLMEAIRELEASL